VSQGGGKDLDEGFLFGNGRGGTGTKSTLGPRESEPYANDLGTKKKLNRYESQGGREKLQEAKMRQVGLTACRRNPPRGERDTSLPEEPQQGNKGATGAGPTVDES